jgi:hypothetical protein
MDSGRTSTIAPGATEILLCSFVRGERKRALRSQLAARYPEVSADAIDEGDSVRLHRAADPLSGGSKDVGEVSMSDTAVKKPGPLFHLDPLLGDGL